VTSRLAWLQRQWVRYETLRGLVLLAPTLLLMLGLMIVPLILVVAQSFWTQDGFVVAHTPTLANYAKLFGGESANYWRLLLKSIEVSFIAAGLVVVLAYPVAYYMAFGVARQKFLWLVLIIIATVNHAARHRRGQPDGAVGLAQHDGAAVRADGTAVEVAHNLPAAEDFKSQLQRVTVYRHRSGPFWSAQVLGRTNTFADSAPPMRLSW
jgi:hypothetical protein